MTDADFKGNSGVVYIGYAQIMHRFQRLEMNLWAIKALHFKPGIQEHQAFEKLAAWDTSVTYGQMVNQVGDLPGWPEELPERLKASVGLRNYLAHRFLREFFVVKDTAANYAKAIDALASWATSVEALDADVEAHLTTLDGGQIDEELAAELADFQPTEWPLR